MGMEGAKCKDAVYIFATCLLVVDVMRRVEETAVAHTPAWSEEREDGAIQAACIAVLSVSVDAGSHCPTAGLDRSIWWMHVTHSNHSPKTVCCRRARRRY